MREIHDATNRGNKFVHLRFRNHERRRNFQDHEIISANLGKNAVVAKQTHDHNLPKHCRMNLRECFEGNPQAQAARSGEFDPQQQSHAAHGLHHLVRGKLVRQTALQLVSHEGGAASELLALQHIQSGQAGAHRQTVFAESGRVNDGPFH